MIEIPVKVLAQRDGHALVESRESGSCGACASQGSCGIAGLGRFLSGRRQPIALDCGEARPGQALHVAIAEADLLKASLWAYLLPTLLALIGAVILARWGDVAAVAGAALGLMAGLGFARRFATPPRLSITPGESP